MITEPKVTYERPRKFTPNNVCYWEKTSKQLMVHGEKSDKVLLTKAKKFLEQNCIELKSYSKWICKPLKDYNKTTYEIDLKGHDFSCNCQGYNKKLNDGVEDPICSHILAVKQFIFLQRENGNN